MHSDEISARKRRDTTTHILELIGLGAVALSIAGMTHQYTLLRNFGVSLSDYADIDDFLVASINLLTAIEYFDLVNKIKASLLAMLPFVEKIIHVLGFIIVRIINKKKEAATKSPKWFDF